MGTRASRPLAELLPYVACGSIGGFGPLHLLDDGSIGYAIEFDLPVVDTRVDGEARISAIIDQALRVLPPEVQWQWFVLASPFVGAQLQRYVAQPGHDGLGQACVQHLLRRWQLAQREGFFPTDAAVNFFPRSQSIVLALKSPPVGLAAGLAALRDRPAGGLRERTAGFIDAARTVRGAIDASGALPVAVDADRLANVVAGLLFPWRRFDRGPIVTGLHGVREAVASLGCIDPIEPAGFRSLSDRLPAHHRVVSMLWHPRTVSPGMLNALVLSRPCLSVSLTGQTLAPAGTALRLKAQSLLNARSANRFNEIETQARAQALGDVERRLLTDGEKLVEGRLQVHLVEPSAEDADEASRQVCEWLRDQDIEACAETDIASTLILRGCLPFAVYELTERKLRRRRRFLSRDFADIHPAGGCWTGLPADRPEPAASATPIVMYCNAAGEPLFVDPTKAERNPHALVVGQSGSGKSFFVHDYLLHLWRLPEVRLYLVSIKPDYRKLALLLGRYVPLDLDSAESLNPFGGAPTPENQARWVAALTLMLTEGRAELQPSREQEIALQEASLAASARNWDAGARRPIAQTQLEDVCVQLERRAGALGRELALRLQPYRRGPYRRLFNGPRTLGPADRFVFFNLGAILRHPCSAAACFCVFNLIDEVMHDPQLRAVPKGLIADEAWALVQNPFAAAILERSLKAYRSLGGFAIPIVQDPRDLDSPAGRVMLVNTATKIVLPMDRSGQDEICRFVRLNERELDLVRNLRLVKRRYSEFFISIEGVHSAKALLIPDPLRYAISTTDPADEARLEALLAQSGSMLAAVTRFAQEAPFGLATARPAGTGERGAALARWLVALSVLAAAAAIMLSMLTRPPEPAAPLSKERTAAGAAMEPAPAPSRRLTEQALELLLPGTAVPASAPQAPFRPDRAPPHPPAMATAPPARDQVAVVPAAPLRRPPIPDRIEGTSQAGGEVDPLSSMSLQAELIEAAADVAPLSLLELRAQNYPPQARLKSPADAAPGGAWFEAGDVPAAEWLLVSIDADSVTLMSAHGQRVRLRPVGR
jgi:hypothetical protein